MQWGQVTSPTYKLPRQTSSRQVSINLEDSPTRSAVRPPTNTGPRSTRPKSAMRFLASDQERKSEDATEYLSKCEDYIGGMSAFVSNIEGALKRVQRDSIVRKEAVRSEVRRLMQELDRERNTTRKLSLTVDQKNQKIHELTQALKTEQVHHVCPTPPLQKGVPSPIPLNGGPRDASPMSWFPWLVPPLKDFSSAFSLVTEEACCLRKRACFSR